MSEEKKVFCGIEIWTRAKCGLRVRSQGYLRLQSFFDLTMEQRGEAVTMLIANAAKSVDAEVREMDLKYDQARREQGASEA